MTKGDSPVGVLRAAMESLRSWRGSEGNDALIREVTDKAIILGTDLIEGRPVDLINQLRPLTAHAHRALLQYAYVPDPAGNVCDRIVDGMNWNSIIARVLKYIAIIGSPQVSDQRLRAATSGRFIRPVLGSNQEGP